MSLLAKTLADLKIQALIFDMDIDIETLSLMPKSTSVEPAWLTQWKNRFGDGDNDPSDPEQNIDEDNGL